MGQRIGLLLDVNKRPAEQPGGARGGMSLIPRPVLIGLAECWETSDGLPCCCCGKQRGAPIESRSYQLLHCSLPDSKRETRLAISARTSCTVCARRVPLWVTCRHAQPKTAYLLHP